MNFAIPFFKNFKYSNQNIQWNIIYKPKIKQLNNFIKIYGTHRINLLFTDFELHRDCEIVTVLRETFPDTEIIICLPSYNKNLEKTLNEQKLPHYYNEPITDWDKFQGFLKLNVTDIFIAENLAFNIKNLSLNAKKYNKALRCFCNLCETSWENTPSLKTFFIRPEDLYLYQNYIDTFEFYTNGFPLSRLNTLYEIYVKDKKWFGKLNQIIVGYNGEEDSKFIISNFGEKRLNCGKRCFQESQELTCNICDRIIELSNTLKDKNLIATLNKT